MDYAHRGTCLQPADTFEHPVTGFHVASVQAIPVLGADPKADPVVDYPATDTAVPIQAIPTGMCQVDPTRKPAPRL